MFDRFDKRDTQSVRKRRDVRKNYTRNSVVWFFRTLGKKSAFDNMRINCVCAYKSNIIYTQTNVLLIS